MNRHYWAISLFRVALWAGLWASGTAAWAVQPETGAPAATEPGPSIKSPAFEPLGPGDGDWLQQGRERGSNADLAAKLDALTKKYEAQDAEIQQLRAQVSSGSNLAAMTDTDRTLLAQMIKDEVAKSDALRSNFPHGLDGLNFAGDIRLRYEGQFFGGRTKGKLTPEDYDVLRYRLRFGFTKDINEDWSLGFRLSTGNGTDPWQSNQTMTGDFVRNPIFVDQAWIQYKPRALTGELTVVGGRFESPFVGTEMTMDPSLTLSGLAENWTHKCTDELSTFATLGQLFLEQNRSNGNDNNSEATALLAYQLGLRYKLAPDVTWTLAGMLWEYVNVNRDAAMGTDEAAGQTNNIPLGNSLLPANKSGQVFLAAKDFDMLDICTELAFRLGPNKTPLRVFGDLVWNVDDQATGAYKGKDFAAIGGVALGKINWKKGDWEIGYNYRYVQADSMIAVFSDNAFWGTDKQGHSLAARYGVADNVTFNLRYVHFDWITDKVDPARDMVRFEVEARF